jgi:sugar phosphate isomerase/epimerase
MAFLMIGMSSTWMATRGLGIRQSIERCFELGFGLVEVGAGHKYEPDAVGTVIELHKKHPDMLFTVHALFPPVQKSYAMNIADAKEHARIVGAVSGMFGLAKDIGADVVGLHGGYCGHVGWGEAGRGGFKELVMEGGMTREKAMTGMLVVLERLVAIAEDAGVKLALEIAPDGAWNPIPKTPNEFDEVFSRFGSKMFGLLLDVGHLHRTAAANGYDPYDFTALFKDRVFEVHLHDIVDGEDHHAVGTGEIDFARHFKIIGRERLESIPLVFEYTNLVDEAAALHGKERIEKIMESLK